jgi:peptidoglycan/LPS O-acetylase OafA/YrhL
VLIAATATATDAPRFYGDVLAALFYVPNWRFIVTGQSYDVIFSDPSPVQHFWSLGIEEQFYFFFPLMMLAWMRVGRGSNRLLGWTLVGLVGLSAATMWLARVPGEPLGHAYYGTDARAAELLMGALLALLTRSAKLPPGAKADRIIDLVGASALVFSVVLWLTASDAHLGLYRGGIVGYALLTSAVLLAGVRGGWTERLLSLSALTFIGRISYGLYVYHWPIYLLVDESRTGLDGPPLMALRLGLSFLAAVVSKHLVEDPIRQRRALPGRHVWIAAGCSMGLLTAVVAALAGVATRANELEPVAQEERALLGKRPLRAMVVGNSVAGNLAVGLKRWGWRNLLKVYDRTEAGCGLSRGGERNLKYGVFKDSDDEKCIEWTRRWPRLIEKIDPDVVLVLTGSQDLSNRKLPGWPDFLDLGDPVFDAWLISEYVTFIDTMSMRGAAIVWANWPCMKHKGYKGRWTDSGVFDLDRALYLNDVILPAVQTQRPEIEIFDLFGLVCPDGEFTREFAPVENAREDGVHFKLPEAAWVVDRLAPILVTNARPR